MRVVSKRWCWWIYHKIGEINKPDSRKSCFHHSVVNFGSISFLQKKDFNPSGFMPNCSYVPASYDAFLVGLLSG